jgi:hypothetical protein
VNLTRTSQTPTLALDRWCLIASLVLPVLGVIVAVWGAQISYGVVLQRERSCDGALEVPRTAFALEGLAIVLLAAAVAITVIGITLWWPRARDGARDGENAELLEMLSQAGFTSVVLVAGVLFTAFCVLAVITDAPTSVAVCAG